MDQGRLSGHLLGIARESHACVSLRLQPCGPSTEESRAPKTALTRLLKFSSGEESEAIVLQNGVVLDQGVQRNRECNVIE